MSGDHGSWSKAYGKVILLGEHAVVYGVPALAVGIHRGASARLVSGPADADVMLLEALRVNAGDSEDLARAFQAVLLAAGRGGEGDRVTVEVRTELPPGGGLGCSAALAVAVARALRPDADDHVVAECAMGWERMFHGNPSGIDAAVSASGGCIAYQRGRGFDNVRIPPGGLILCVGESGVPSSTKTMVEGVARFRERRPEIAAKLFAGIESLVRNCRLAIEAGDLSAVGRFLDLNQMLLSGLFLSTPEIERMCSIARDSGALGAKLTGAGGGGCVVALAGDSAAADKVLEAWKADGLTGFRADVRGSHVQETAQASPAVAEGP
jgi:mevalonate kinase